MKPGKVLYCMVLFPVLGVDLAQNRTKYTSWLFVLIHVQLNNRKIAIMLIDSV